MRQPTKEGTVWEGSVWEGSVRSIAQSIQEVLPSLRPHESPVQDHAKFRVPQVSQLKLRQIEAMLSGFITQLTAQRLLDTCVSTVMAAHMFSTSSL